MPSFCPGFGLARRLLAGGLFSASGRREGSKGPGEDPTQQTKPAPTRRSRNLEGKQATLVSRLHRIIRLGNLPVESENLSRRLVVVLLHALSAAEHERLVYQGNKTAQTKDAFLNFDDISSFFEQSLAQIAFHEHQ